MKTAAHRQELERIDSVFTVYNSGNTLPSPSDSMINAEREIAFVRALISLGMNTLCNKDILDFGCGTGAVTRRFVELGADSNRIVGIDVTEARIAEAKRLSPNIHFQLTAENLPFDPESFDIILAFTVFSSILDPAMRRQAASEAWRVLRPSGTLLWFDFTWNPTNRQTLGIKLPEIAELFPDANLRSFRAILAPPLSRVSSRAPLIRAALQSIPLFRSHLMVTISKESQ